MGLRTRPLHTEGSSARESSIQALNFRLFAVAPSGSPAVPPERIRPSPTKSPAEVIMRPISPLRGLGLIPILIPIPIVILIVILIGNLNRRGLRLRARLRARLGLSSLTTPAEMTWQREMVVSPERIR